MMWRDPGTPADDYYPVRPECTNVPESSFRIKNGKTLSERRWRASFSPEGHIDMSKVLSRIHRGGVHPSIRGEVWEFLLGCYDPNSSLEERQEIREHRRMKYKSLKATCRQLFPLIGSGKFVTAPVIKENGEATEDPIVIQQITEVIGELPAEDYQMDQKEINWKLTLHQIGLDVVRTDRTLVFFERQENLSKLWDVLAVYAWFDADVGYGQGMSDLCSPMLILLEDESDAFWCFERLMRKMRGNFRCSGETVGVETQLGVLASVIQVVDPKLHQHLENLGSGDYLFAFRMLMVLFRREFSFGDSLFLWEMMWALEFDPNLFSLYEDSSDSGSEIPDGAKPKPRSRRQFGKFERENMKSGSDPLPITVFLIANVIKENSAKLQAEARGLDDVVKILNDCNGNLDAKKACAGAMKLHKKYLKMLPKT